MNTRILNMLGIANKAGKLVTGEDSVISGLQKRKVKMVFVSNDASASTVDKFDKKCFFYHVDCITLFNYEELSSAIGRNRKIVGVTDSGICDAIKKIMEESK